MARRVLGEGGGILQPLDAHLEHELVLEEQGVVHVVFPLAALQRHPVQGIVGEKIVPVVQGAFVDELRFPVDQGAQVRAGGGLH